MLILLYHTMHDTLKLTYFLPVLGGSKYWGTGWRINESESVEINHGRIKMSPVVASFLCVQLLIKIWLKHAKILDQKASSIWAI